MNSIILDDEMLACTIPYGCQKTWYLSLVHGIFWSGTLIIYITSDFGLVYHIVGPTGGKGDQQTRDAILTYNYTKRLVDEWGHK
jgi:hypothetical protein